ncbi:MAG: HepT-like ribonuclease domain-containing protein [Candidatus Nanopelagicales bacterium]
MVGEAASNVSESAMAIHPDVDWRSIARLRIVLAHHYHRTDPDLVWPNATVEAPAFASGRPRPACAPPSGAGVARPRRAGPPAPRRDAGRSEGAVRRCPPA